MMMMIIIIVIVIIIIIIPGSRERRWRGLPPEGTARGGAPVRRRVLSLSV